ncbi:MAG: alpha/beta hydrolase family protein, partial [Pseudomonadales bacterium]
MLLAMVLASPTTAAADDGLDPAWISALRGNYQLPNGEVGYLGGWPAHGWRGQRLFVEIAGERHRLRAVSPDRLVNETDGDILRVQVGAEGEILGLEWPQGSGTVASRVELYADEEVSFQSGGHALAGSLFVPAGGGNHPGIVLVHGSGPDTREPYRNLADHFARNGVAALIYDKRGLGGGERRLARRGLRGSGGRCRGGCSLAAG